MSAAARPDRPCLYLDCPGGVSGDMLLGALIDLGVEPDAIAAPLRSLPLGEWSLTAREVDRAGLRARQAVVRVEREGEAARTLAEIEALLGAGALPDAILSRAVAVFRRLAAAEARVYGESIDQVHVHEVGRTDAVVDIVGTLLALDRLAVGDVHCSALPLESEGVARGGHGPVPLPAPATLEILSRVSAPIRAGDPATRSEQVTPTGAALVAELATFGRPPLRLARAGVGAGARDDPGRPNILRAWLGVAERAAALPLRPVVVLETNVDDVTGEQASFAVERIRAAGALDVWVAAAAMKKGRSGLRVSAVARPDVEAAVATAMLRELPTLGVRVRDERRYEAQREVRQVATPLGPATVKLRRLPGEPPAVAPEYEDCATLARSSGRPIGEVFAMVEAAARAAIGAPPDETASVE
jgi:hypothetical protein